MENDLPITAEPVAENSKTSNQQVANEPTLGYAWYVVIVLMICYTLSFIDRQILSLLVAPIKQDLGISDAKISAGPSSS